jgi:ABC-type Fe3+/spermidine/putrescine transport system ATPase subunit
MLRVLDVSKSFQLPNRVKFQAVKSVGFHVPKGSFFTLLVQSGAPEVVYNQPNSRFVASFIGSTNILPGKVSRAPNEERIGMVDTEVGAIRCVFSVGRQNYDVLE